MKISAVMPSKNNLKLVSYAVNSLLAQTRLPDELVFLRDFKAEILDLGSIAKALSEKCVALKPSHSLGSEIGIGHMRNMANKMASGDIIFHWDDDDYSAPSRIQKSVDFLQECDIVGSSLALFSKGKDTYLFDGRKLTPTYILGGTLAYHRSVWNAIHFPDVPYGEDSRWQWAAREAGYKIGDLENEDLYLATIHEGNTSGKDTSSLGWEKL